MEKIKLQISDKVSIEIENPTDVMEKYSQDFYTYCEHEYEIDFKDGELTDNKLREEVLEKHFKGSKNTELSEVLIKVAVLDNFYRTRIPANNIVPIARHIVEMKIDDRLHKTPIDVDLVNEIAYSEKTYKTKSFKTDRVDLHIKINNVYSFATKYCSWHNSNYPIADSYSKGMLFYINKARPFYKIGGIKMPSKVSLNNYRVFCEMYKKFRERYFSNTPDISNKVIDTYLWKYAQNKISDLRSQGLDCSESLDGSKRISDYFNMDSSDLSSDFQKEVELLR